LLALTGIGIGITAEVITYPGGGAGSRIGGLQLPVRPLQPDPRK
jgi:hypothetical protein